MSWPPDRVTTLRVLAGAACALPLAWLVLAWQRNALGFAPAEAAVHFLGRVGLALLVITAALGTVAHVLRAPRLLTLHPLLGVAAFTYLALHALAWAGLDMGWAWSFITAELADLRYLQLGLVSLALLIPLALTTGRELARHRGAGPWHWLHRLGYVAVAAGLVHLWMVTRGEALLPGLYLTLFAALVTARAGAPAVQWWQRRRGG